MFESKRNNFAFFPMFYLLIIISIQINASEITEKRTLFEGKVECNSESQVFRNSNGDKETKTDRFQANLEIIYFKVGTRFRRKENGNLINLAEYKLIFTNESDHHKIVRKVDLDGTVTEIASVNPASKSDDFYYIPAFDGSFDASRHFLTYFNINVYFSLNNFSGNKFNEITSQTSFERGSGGTHEQTLIRDVILLDKNDQFKILKSTKFSVYKSRSLNRSEKIDSIECRLLN